MRLNKDDILVRIANRLLIAMTWWQHRLFVKATRNVRKAQEKTLFEIIRKNAKTEYGRMHNLQDIKDVKAFQKLPLTSYDDYQNEIGRIANGEKNVLTSEDVMMFEPSSGSVAASKLIPYTPSLKKQFQRGIYPWLHDTYTKTRVSEGTSYWSMTPVNHKTTYTKGKIPIGFEDDSEYLGHLLKHAFRAGLCVPPIVSKIEDFDSFRYVTLLYLLKGNPSFISIWNPTLLKILIEPLKENYDTLMKDVLEGTLSTHIPPLIRTRLHLRKNKRRAKEMMKIKKMMDEEGFHDLLFSGLSMISCWADSSATQHAKELAEIFRAPQIQPKGLISTEAFVSFPMAGSIAPVLSVRSHFFEFIDTESGEINLADQLVIGRSYSVVVTTGGGLYRYRLQDVIQTVGFFREAPLIKFIGKEDNISDRFGEKVNEIHLNRIFERLKEKHQIRSTFCMAAPERHQGMTRYVVYIETTTRMAVLKRFESDVEKALRKNYHYDYCRRIKQLGEASLYRIERGAQENYVTKCREAGQRIGNIKPRALSKESGWDKVFEGRYIENCH